MGIVPRSNSTGGVDVPSFRISGSVVGLRCVPNGEDSNVSASRSTRCGSRYTPDNRCINVPNDSDDIFCLLNILFEFMWLYFV